MGYGNHLDGCGNFMKYSMFIINFIIFLGSVIVTGLGIWILVDRSFSHELLGTDMYIGSVYVITATGILIAFISCFGCFGSAKEVRCMLVTYFIVVFLIFVTMLIGGILSYVFRAKVETTLRNAMIGSLRDYGQYKPITEAWDETQARLQCCGVNSWRDWKSQIPDSCCQEPVPGKKQRCNLLVETQNSFTLFQKGCYNVTAEYVKEHAAIIGGAGIVVSGFMILGMIFSFALYKMIKEY